MSEPARQIGGTGIVCDVPAEFRWRQTEAAMWIEVDLAGYMRAIPAGVLKARIQRVSDQEMAAIKAAVESTP